eukprot:CAMPEP_0172758490 /NCGR_PEP_ID=MMETSP1074-20121228/165855_1 /TAXON_ID=2916 /ORGANISM="Ceratium fusus, Strain PA161109" /LENGTH=56 /DNA_ID=CAMNT_0013592097 /DNA_START=184 /DNA_END=354 /DNA_ORIENTATION=+
MKLAGWVGDVVLRSVGLLRVKRLVPTGKTGVGPRELDECQRRTRFDPAASDVMKTW